MANLYDISDKLVNLIENSFDIETGEVYDSQEELDKAIDACELDLDTKLENIGCYIKNLEADVEALKKEEDNLYRRRKSTENKIEGLKRYLNGYLSACYPNEEDKAKWAETALAYQDTLQSWIDDATAAGYDGAAIMADYLKNGEEMGYTWVFDTSKYM